MATKYLARTIIEGGRSSSNQWDRIKPRRKVYKDFYLAGQHIIFDHLLHEVLAHEPREPRHHRYLYVDKHGILRAPKAKKRKSHQRPAPQGQCV